MFYTAPFDEIDVGSYEFLCKMRYDNNYSNNAVIAVTSGHSICFKRTKFVQINNSHSIVQLSGFASRNMKERIQHA